MRLADYMIQFLADYGVRHIFMLTGGAAMHLNDAIGQEKRIQYICNHHEQACAIAAEGYARVTGKIGVLCVTNGAGGINALNGVFGAWTDSVPILVISGQVKRETCLTQYDIPGLRQLGDQEADIIRMVKGITKYAVSITDPLTVRYHLERAVYLATHGRPGPCWIDIPVDVQGWSIEPDLLPGYDPNEDAVDYGVDNLPGIVRETLDRLSRAERPVIMVGKGVRLAGAEALFHKLIRMLNVPVTTAWTGLDMLPSDHPLYVGRPGDLGTRPGNFAVQNSDVLLVLGCRLGIRQVSYNWKSFARHAFRIMVDADHREMEKPTVRVHMKVHTDLKLFLAEMDRQLASSAWDGARHQEWLGWCRERLARYPVVLPRHRVVRDGLINPYYFMERLFELLAADDVVVCSVGAANVITFQVANIRPGQRLFCNTGNASMGYGLPAAVGAAVARSNRGRVIGIEGDGGIQLNIQELQTLAQYRWHLKFLVINNQGYLSIRQTQAGFFKRLTGESPASGVTFPDMVALARAYKLSACRIEGNDFDKALARFLSEPGPGLAEVMVDGEQQMELKLSPRVMPDGSIVSPPLEDMFPFLDREELKANMLVPVEE